MDTEELLKNLDYDEAKMERPHYNEDSMRIELNWWQSSLFFVGCLPCIFCMTVCGAVCCLATAACCLGTTLLGAATYCGTCCCCSNCCGGCKTKLSERRGILKNKDEEQTFSQASSFSRTTQKHQEKIIHCTRNVPDINAPSTSTANEEVKKPLKGILRNKGKQMSYTNSSSVSHSTSNKENGRDNLLDPSIERKLTKEVMTQNGEEKSTQESSTIPQSSSNVGSRQEKIIDRPLNERQPLQEKLENEEKQTSMDSSTLPELSSNIGNSQEKLLDALNEKRTPKEVPHKNEGKNGRSDSTSVLQSTCNMGSSKEKLLDSKPLPSDDEGSSLRDSLPTPDKEARNEALLSTTPINKEDQKDPKKSSSHSELIKRKKKSRLLSIF